MNTNKEIKKFNLIPQISLKIYKYHMPLLLKNHLFLKNKTLVFNKTVIINKNKKKYSLLIKMNQKLFMILLKIV